MTVREVTSGSGLVSLECNECGPQPNYILDPPLIHWHKSCVHIEEYMAAFEDMGTLKPETKYQMNLSPYGSYVCRDPWAMWITFTTGPVTDTGLMLVSFNYESDFYTSTRDDLGYITPDDGRESIRNMLWDWVASQLYIRQHRAEEDGLRCPQTTHKEQTRFARECAISQDSVNAQVASIVFENCCTFCYREVMGQDGTDGNFGMDGVQAGRASRPINQSPQPFAASSLKGSRNQSSTPGSRQTVTSIRSGSVTPSTPSSSSSSPGAGRPSNVAPPPWER